MIVVLASRHDEVARELVARWPGAALCSADDLTLPGWVWPVEGGSMPSRWIVGGASVPDERVTSVFVRRSTVYDVELTRTHRDDRAYLAMECHAFLAHVLSRTDALVVNPVDGTGAFGEASLRPERWMQAAAAEGVAFAPLRVGARSGHRAPERVAVLELVDLRAVGPADAALAGAAAAVCRRLGLLWAVAAFDGLGRLSALTTTPRPSAAARGVLGERLARGKAA